MSACFCVNPNCAKAGVCLGRDPESKQQVYSAADIVKQPVVEMPLTEAITIARKHARVDSPSVSRTLISEVDRLRARVAELEAAQKEQGNG